MDTTCRAIRGNRGQRDVGAPLETRCSSCDHRGRCSRDRPRGGPADCRKRPAAHHPVVTTRRICRRRPVVRRVQIGSVPIVSNPLQHVSPFPTAGATGRGGDGSTNGEDSRAASSGESGDSTGGTLAAIPYTRSSNSASAWSTRQDARFAACWRPNPQGTSTWSINAEIRTPCFCPYSASCFTQSDAIDFWDHTATTHLAALISRSMTASHVSPGSSLRSHHTVHPWASRAAARGFTRAFSSWV